LAIRRGLSVGDETAEVGRSKRVDGSGVARGRRLVGRCLDYLESDLGGTTVLVAAMAVSVAVSLYLTRGTTFWFDEFSLYAGNRGFDLNFLLTPHNGQLIFLPRLIYATIFELFGPDYLVVRVVEAVGVALVGATVYALARPRIGAAALAPAILLMFFGYSWDSTLTGNGIINVYCVLPGLAALLVLDRRPRFADPLACLLLAASLACWSAGLAFVAGAAVLLLQRGELRRAAWVFAIPLLLWGAWWIVRPGLSGPLYTSATNLKARNVLLIPNFTANSFAATLAAITGLNFDFAQTSPAIYAPSFDTSWGAVLAVITIIGLAWVLRRRPLATWPWPWLAVLVTFWSATAMVSFSLRLPDAGRYVYVAAAALMVLGAWALAPFRLTPRLAPFALAALVVALAANIAHLRDASTYLRTYATSVRADLAAVEIARGHESPAYLPAVGALSSPLLSRAAQAGTYLRAVDRNGSFADTLPELRAAAEHTREEADQVLAGALGLQLTPTTAPASSFGCRRVHATSSGVTFELPRNGGRILAPSRSAFTLRRFASAFTVELGKNRSPWSALRLPTDLAPDRWWAHVASTHPVRVCRL
jgi:hypothetical protein